MGGPLYGTAPVSFVKLCLLLESFLACHVEILFAVPYLSVDLAAFDLDWNAP